MITHRYRLESQAPEGWWGIVAGTDTRGDAILFFEAAGYRGQAMRIVDLETGKIEHLPKHHRQKHAVYADE